MAFRTVRDIVVLKHTQDAPSQVEWDELIARCRRTFDRHQVMRTFVFSEGGGPNGDQRGDLNDLLGGRPQRVAVLNESRWVRGVVTALSWFNPEIRAFQLGRMEEAFDHLRMASPERDAVQEALREITSELADGASARSACTAGSHGEGP